MAFVMEFLSTKFVSFRAGSATKRGGAALGRGDGAAAVAAFSEAVEAKAQVLKTSRHATVARAMNQLAAAHRLNGDQVAAAQVAADISRMLQSSACSPLVTWCACFRCRF